MYQRTFKCFQDDAIFRTSTKNYAIVREQRESQRTVITDERLCWILFHFNQLHQRQIKKKKLDYNLCNRFPRWFHEIFVLTIKILLRPEFCHNIVILSVYGFYFYVPCPLGTAGWQKNTSYVT